jgi:Domain of unknown function (DUF4167)
MRDFKGMKRQRNRGRGGGGGSGGGGGKPQHNANRAFDSNGPDNVKVRGAAQHIFEKYSQLARDAGSAGDRVLAENYLQHAEHYFRVLRAMQPQRPVSEIMGRDQFVSGYDIDFEDEGQNGDETAEAEADSQADGRRDGQWQQRDERPRDDRQPQQGEYRQRDDRPRDDRPRDDRQRDDYRPRDERPQGEFRQRDDRQQAEYRQRDDRPREERPRDDRPRDDRPREDRYQGGDRQSRYPREDRQGRYQNDRPQGQQGRQDREFRGERDPQRDPLSVIEPQATPITAATTASAPTYEPHESAAGVLRGEDGAMSHAPAFLQSAPRAEATPEVNGDEPAEVRRPRRRRAPRTFEPGQAAPAEVDEG